MTGECVVGPATGKKLAWIPSQVMTWREWKTAHPETTVLAPQGDFRRYQAVERDYADYRRRGRPFPEFLGDKVRYPATYKPMDVCTVVGRGAQARCYPHPALKPGKTRDGDLTIEKRGDRVTVRDADGNLVPSLQGYWFAFFAFYPKGTVWKPPPE